MKIVLHALFFNVKLCSYQSALEKVTDEKNNSIFECSTSMNLETITNNEILKVAQTRKLKLAHNF